MGLTQHRTTHAPAWAAHASAASVILFAASAARVQVAGMMDEAADAVMGLAGTRGTGAEAAMEAEAAEVVVDRAVDETMGAAGAAMEAEAAEVVADRMVEKTMGVMQLQAAVMVETDRTAPGRSPFAQVFNCQWASPRCP